MTTSDILDKLLEELNAGTLTADRLRQDVTSMCAQRGTQDLLYLQATRTSLTSQIVGMTMICDGKVDEGAADADDWPYQTVLEAVQDGWRIISFPNMALMTVDIKEAYGLGFEFILEKWRG
jgi:hypothetical protein